jgi:hypothetical protein
MHPSDDLAIFVETRLDAMDVDRPVITALDIVFARPDDFNGIALP